VHGPHPRDHDLRVNKKMKKGALRAALTDALQAAGGREFGRNRIAGASLMRSELSPRGARYTELAALKLGGGVEPSV